MNVLGTLPFQDFADRSYAVSCPDRSAEQVGTPPRRVGFDLRVVAFVNGYLMPGSSEKVALALEDDVFTPRGLVLVVDKEDPHGTIIIQDTLERCHVDWTLQKDRAFPLQRRFDTRIFVRCQP